MQKDTNKRDQSDEKIRKNEPSFSDPRITEAAHQQADKDIAKDPEFSAHSPNDDLDEAESARLGEDKTDLV